MNVPFSIGTTINQVNDESLTELEKTAPFVDHVVLKDFCGNQYSHIDSSVITSLQKIGEKSNIEYAILLPVSENIIADLQDSRVEAFVDAFNVIELTKRLPVSKYIVHFIEGEGVAESKCEIKKWRRYCLEFVANLASVKGLYNRKIAIENTTIPIDWYSDIVVRMGFSFCLNLRNLWSFTENWTELLDDQITKSDLICTHSVNDENYFFSPEENTRTNHIVNALVDKGYKKVLTIDSSSYDEVKSIHDRAEQLLKKSL